ncbi:hypothetical protein CHUAL_009588 [Chamberlinius hualienensis]
MRAVAVGRPYNLMHSDKCLSTGMTSSDQAKHKIIISCIIKVFWLVMLTALEMEKREGSILPMDLDVEELFATKIGYYLEAEPCLACSNPEVSLANVTLSSLKMDSCYMTTTEIIKLTAAGQSHLKTIIETLLMRRTKDQMGTSGKPLKSWTKFKFFLKIKDIYDKLLLRSHDLFLDQANMAKVLELLLHMQQCFCHLSLLNLEAETPDYSLDDRI